MTFTWSDGSVTLAADDVEAYVATLPEPWPTIYRQVSRIDEQTEDTLSEEFQLAAKVIDQFVLRARQWKGLT